MKTTAKHIRGFTLIELVVVIAVMALLAGIAMPVVAVSLRIAETDATWQRMEDLSKAVTDFYKDTDQFPGNLQELVSASGIACWAGPYVNEGFSEPKGNIFYDAWHNAFQYSSIDSSNARLMSWGLNAQDDGGTGDDIVLNVSVEPVLREKNLKLLAEVNDAIRLYNLYYRMSRVEAGADGFTPPGQVDNPGNGTPPGQSKKNNGGSDEGSEEVVVDTPLTGPWAITLSMLVQQGLLNNSNGRYTGDAWGNAFITGPDPVQYVTSGGSQ
ncbi:MAG TPA: type II secretion system protein GspG [Planctomycetota bacterium]|nr:type II secretion system protein GspG [Planctomycetota bacterium]